MNSPEFDALKRAFDPKKFLPRLDALGRWVNARAGRRSTKRTKKPLRLSSPTMEKPTENATPQPPAAPAETVAAAAPAPDSPTPPPPASAPSFADVEAAIRSAPAPADAPDPATPAQADTIDCALGQSVTVETCIGIIQTALVLMGDDEGVLSPAEKLMLRPPMERVLKKYGVGDLPPELDLAVAFAVLIIARLQKPKTATFFAKVKLWFGGKIAEAKGRALAADVRDAVKS